MLGCMSCLNGLSTSREIFNAVQVTLQGAFFDLSDVNFLVTVAVAQALRTLASC